MKNRPKTLVMNCRLNGEAYEGGVDALIDQNRRKPNIKNRVDPKIEEAVLVYAIEYPAHGQVRTSNELRKQGVLVLPSGVRSIWLRHELANFKDRLKALEAKVAVEGLILTEAQVQALEKKKLDDEVHGEIETAHPGYLGSQDTFYVGTLKGVGRIYQQTFIDTYAKVAFARLYTIKTPITAADLLNDKVLPFFEQHDLSVLRVLPSKPYLFNNECRGPGMIDKILLVFQQILAQFLPFLRTHRSHECFCRIKPDFGDAIVFGHHSP